MTSLPTLCDDAVALVANHLAPASEEWATECGRRSCRRVRICAALATLGRVCKALRSTMKTHPTQGNFRLGLFRTRPGGRIRGRGTRAELGRNALLEPRRGANCVTRTYHGRGAAQGASVRLSVTSARVKAPAASTLVWGTLPRGASHSRH